jgi:hypothetical protein
MNDHYEYLVNHDVYHFLNILYWWNVDDYFGNFEKTSKLTRFMIV